MYVQLANLNMILSNKKKEPINWTLLTIYIRERGLSFFFFMYFENHYLDHFFSTKLKSLPNPKVRIICRKKNLQRCYIDLNLMIT